MKCHNADFNKSICFLKKIWQAGSFVNRIVDLQFGRTLTGLILVLLVTVTTAVLDHHSTTLIFMYLIQWLVGEICVFRLAHQLDTENQLNISQFCSFASPMKPIIKSFANFVRNDFYCLQRSYRSAFEIHGGNDYNISEKMRTTETPFAPFGSVTIGLGDSENGTRKSLTVSEIFDRKHIALNAIFLYSY